MTELMGIKLINKSNSFYHSYCVHTWLKVIFFFLLPVGVVLLLSMKTLSGNVCIQSPGEEAVAHIYHSVNLSWSVQKDIAE